jgi:hypothetical protein
MLAQNNTFSPYSRYGIGELSQSTFAHNTGMGGAYIALRPDSTTPVFVNVGNPASFSLIRLTSLEVGGRFKYSRFSGAGDSKLNKWSANFAYATLGFPIRGNGGAAFGIMPYSDVGYETQSYKPLTNVGNVLYNYQGNGGLNKVFLGYGVQPFHKNLINFRQRQLYVPDSVRRLGHTSYRVLEFGSKLLSDFSIGVNANYIFGAFQNSTRVVYPNSLLYLNSYREHVVTVGDFTGNFGAQTAITIDSIRAPKKRKAHIEQVIENLKAEGLYTDVQLQEKRDSLLRHLPMMRKVMRERVKICFGYTGNIQNPLRVTYNSAVYNYVLNGSGQEIIRDTALFNINQNSHITLPLEQGFGVALKKGERLNIVADYAITDWSSFRFLDQTTDLVKNFRVSAGVNYVPEKYAAGQGAFLRTVNYRFGASYQNGFIKANNLTYSDYFVSLGVGMPVGINRRSAMVNLSLQVGQMGINSPDFVRQNYMRVNFGFTFCDKWFQKFRYD